MRRKTKIEVGFKVLAQQVEDVCHFGFKGDEKIENSKAVRVVHNIFDTVAKMTKYYGEVKIDGFGTFYLHTTKEHYRRVGKKTDFTGKVHESEIIYVPSKKQLRWRPTNEFKKAINQYRSEDEQQA